MIRDFWTRIFKDLYDRNGDSAVHLEKTPSNSLFLDEIIRVFPNAKIIFLTRDSRAVTSSLVHAGRGWGAYWAPNNYRDAAILWYLHVRSVLTWRAQNPNHSFIFVRYEDVVRDTQGELERMLRFLLPDVENLEVDATLQAFNAGQERTKDPKGFSRKRGATGWRRDMSLYGKLVTWRYTRKVMRELGYGISIYD